MVYDERKSVLTLWEINVLWHRDQKDLLLGRNHPWKRDEKIGLTRIVRLKMGKVSIKRVPVRFLTEKCSSEIFYREGLWV